MLALYTHFFPEPSNESPLATPIEHSSSPSLMEADSFLCSLPDLSQQFPLLTGFGPLGSGIDVPVAQTPQGVASLDDGQRLIFEKCGAKIDVQATVLRILHSDEYHTQKPLPWPMASPLLSLIWYQKSNIPEVKNGKGCRGAPEFYECRWGECRVRMRRKLHALEHIHNHVCIRPYICDKWFVRSSYSVETLLTRGMSSNSRKGFVRNNELLKHTPCKTNKNPPVCVVAYCRTRG